MGPQALDSLPRPAADARVAYGPDSLQFGELRLPRGDGPFPVAVVIHGGCWLAQYAHMDYMSAFADALRRRGAVSWNIEYRPTDRPGGGWPGTFQDVGAAADHLRALAKQYPIDTSRVVTVGHSAGGLLALWLAARPRLPTGSAIRGPDPLAPTGAVSLGGPGDLREFLRSGPKDCSAPVIPLLGGTPSQVPEHYHDASPAERLPLGVPQSLVAGEWDRILPARQAAAYQSSAQSAGDDVRSIRVDGEGHFEIVRPGSQSELEAEHEVLRLLRTEGD
jgi:acetyl esterase/lipase